MNAPKPFAVVVDGRRRAMPWGRFETHLEAAKTAEKLRLHGIAARVVGPDDLPLEEPEHDNDRRKFMIWALMLGATTPAVVAERIVEEVEAQS